jgi:Domain of unknown function (DUF397)
MTTSIDACWQKSSFSMGNGNCVETALLADRSVAVRDSKQPDEAVLIFTESEWAAFVAGAKNDEFDF